MGRGGRFSRYRRASGGSRAHYYASRRGMPADERERGFAPILVLLPLAAFSAVFLLGGLPAGFAMPWDAGQSDDAEIDALYRASEAQLARKRWPITPEMLDGAQPDLPQSAGVKLPPCTAGAWAECGSTTAPSPGDPSSPPDTAASS